MHHVKLSVRKLFIMSFLTSLGQYVAGVADSVAGLALSPRRAPPSRHRSAEETQAKQPQPSTATMRGLAISYAPYM